MSKGWVADGVVVRLRAAERNLAEACQGSPRWLHADLDRMRGELFAHIEFVAANGLVPDVDDDEPFPVDDSHMIAPDGTHAEHYRSH